jgi:hypothetical protein
MVMLSLQMFLDLHLVLLTFLLCRSCAGHLTGLLAALFQCLSPLVATTFSIAPYSMAAFLVTAAACLVIRHTRTNGWFSLFTGTLMLGIACYLHPVCLAFCAVVAVVVSFRTKRIRRLAVVAGTVSACLAPWIMRNGIAAQYWGFSTSAWDSVCWHSAAEIEARRDNVPVAEIRQRFMEEEGIVDERADQASIAKASERYNLQWASNDSHRSMRNRVAEHRWQRARDTFLTHPLEVLGIQLHADTAFWRTGASDVLRITGYGPPVARTPEAKTVYVLRRLAGLQPEQGAEDSAMAIFLSVVVITITLIRHVGIFLWAMCRLRVRMSAANWLCLLIVVTTWILPGPTNGPHFRVIVEPILSAGAAIGWLCLLGWLKLRIRGEKPIQAEEVDAASFAA